MGRRWLASELRCSEPRNQCSMSWRLLSLWNNPSNDSSETYCFVGQQRGVGACGHTGEGIDPVRADAAGDVVAVDAVENSVDSCASKSTLDVRPLTL